MLKLEMHHLFVILVYYRLFSESNKDCFAIPCQWFECSPLPHKVANLMAH